MHIVHALNVARRMHQTISDKQKNEKMNKIIRANKIYGTVELANSGKIVQYEITEKHLSIETIDNSKLINLWVTTSHYELIEGVEKNVLVPDIGFEIILPVKSIEGRYKANLGIPTSNIIELWEKRFFTTFYNFEYVFLINVKLELEKKEDDIYEINFKGYPSFDREEIINDNYYIESKFSSILEYSINSRWNYNLKN